MRYRGGFLFRNKPVRLCRKNVEFSMCFRGVLTLPYHASGPEAPTRKSGGLFCCIQAGLRAFFLAISRENAPLCFHFLDIVMQSSEFCEEKNAFLMVELFFNDFGGKKL